MEQARFAAALRLSLALVAVLVASRPKITIALSEIAAGAVAQLAVGAVAGRRALAAKAPRITFLAGAGTIVPTLLADTGHDRLYYSLMMSTELTFGTISALFGLNHSVIDRRRHSHLVATVIGSTVIPTAIANAPFMPRHLLPGQQRLWKQSVCGDPVGDLEASHERRNGRLDRYLVVLAGAGLGGLARYIAGAWIMAKYGGRFPLGTLMINVSGPFLIGVLMTL
jgi:hypothetical protein